MPSHRTPAVLSLPTLLVLCTGNAIGQAPIEFTDSGQALDDGSSTSIAVGDLDGDGDDDAIVTNCCTHSRSPSLASSSPLVAHLDASQFGPDASLSVTTRGTRLRWAATEEESRRDFL